MNGAFNRHECCTNVELVPERADKNSFAQLCEDSQPGIAMTPLRPEGSILTEILGLDHVQVAMPPGKEPDARAFYSDVLGLVEEPKPANLARRGGVWFRGGALRLHLGVDADFRPATKAHPAILVRGLAQLAEKCRTAGFPPVTDEPLAGFHRLYVFDPFGNRIELLEPI